MKHRIVTEKMQCYETVGKHTLRYAAHNVLYLACMCFAWISEQTAIISLYGINWLVFINETEWVYCAARAEYHL
jgi:hypothetical protein